MPAIPTRLAEAKQLLNACRWSLDIVPEYNRTVYVAVDPGGTPRRSFVPVDRLFDYARGVFDAQEWDHLYDYAHGVFDAQEWDRGETPNDR
jgi:hypothetical protein